MSIARCIARTVTSLGLFGENIVGIDGGKLKAVNSCDRNFTDAKLLRGLDGQKMAIRLYLSEQSGYCGSRCKPSGQWSGYVTSVLTAFELGHYGVGKRMDWESLLDGLWSFAGSDPDELKTKIRSCLYGHSSEGLLEAISLLVNQGQSSAARALLSEFLKSHHAVGEIQRRLEFILHVQKRRKPSVLSLKSRQKGKEILLREVNEQVAASKFQAAESLLLKALELDENPECLYLLSRVYMLQRRSSDSAEAMRRAQLLERQQEAFIEPVIDVWGDELPTVTDLAFINSIAMRLTSLESDSTAVCESAGNADESFQFIQQAAVEYPLLTDEAVLDEAGTTSLHFHAINGATSNSATVGLYGSTLEPEQDGALTSTAKPTLRLAARKAYILLHEKNEIRVFTKPSCATSKRLDGNANTPERTPPYISIVQAKAVETLVKPSEAELLDQIGELEGFCGFNYEDAVELSQESQLRELESGSSFGELTDDFDLDDDFQGMTLFESIEEYECETSQQESFLDLEDDYAAYAFDPDEVFDGDEDAVKSPSDQLDSLSREDRALQKAVELIGKANWAHSALPLIQQIFVMSGWGATRLALEREIDKGLTPGELILAAHIKVIWAGNDIYWISFDKTGSSRLSHHVLSWPTALLIVRSFQSLPQIEEVEVFLEQLFASWYENMTLRRVFKAFARYLWFRFSNLEGCLPPDLPFDFGSPYELAVEEFSDLGLEDELEVEKTNLLRAYGVFQTKHPQESGCYFSDQPVCSEESVVVPVCAADEHASEVMAGSEEISESISTQKLNTKASTRTLA